LFPRKKGDRPRRKRRWRRTGVTVVTATCLVLLAAWNTGFNLLYLVFAGLASFLILSFFLSRANFRGVSVALDGVAAVHRDEKLPVTAHIENKKRFLPAVALRVEMTQGDRNVSALAVKVPAGGVAHARLDLQFSRRGVYPMPPVRVSTGWPFGLTQKELTIETHYEVIVYPRVGAVRPAVLENLAAHRRAPRIVRGQGDEFFGLRDYADGDDVRQIAWRVSARRRSLVVREFARHTSRHVVIVFDTHLPETAPDLSDDFEEAVELVASLAITFLNQQYAVSVITPEQRLPQGEGTPHARKVLEMLARVNAMRGADNGDFAWFNPTEEMLAATPIFVAADCALWGRRPGNAPGHVLRPGEVLRA
jgi:uncharacterized protein (DUF58 family)